MMLQFTKRPLRTEWRHLAIKGSIHCGPECSRLEREVEGDDRGAGRRTWIFDHGRRDACGQRGDWSDRCRCLTKLKIPAVDWRIRGAAADD